MVAFSAIPWRLVISAAATLAASIPIILGLLKLWETLYPKFCAFRDRRTLRLRLGAELYDAEEIQRATKYYIEPDFQSIDPGGGEDFRRVVSTRERLFSTFDRILENP